MAGKILNFELSTQNLRVKQTLKKDFLMIDIQAISDIYPNRNNSHFTKEAMVDALPTCYNKPILASFNTLTGEFRGHESKMEYDNELETPYYDYTFYGAETPIGIIRTEDKVYIQEDPNTGLNWIRISAALWVKYGYKQIKKLLKAKNGQKKISVEVEVLESHTDSDGVEIIDKFILDGITILGANPNGSPMMEGIPDAHLTIIDAMNTENFQAKEKHLRYAYSALSQEDVDDTNKASDINLVKNSDQVDCEADQDSYIAFSSDPDSINEDEEEIKMNRKEGGKGQMMEENMKETETFEQDAKVSEDNESETKETQSAMDSTNCFEENKETEACGDESQSEETNAPKEEESAMDSTNCFEDKSEEKPAEEKSEEKPEDKADDKQDSKEEESAMDSTNCFEDSKEDAVTDSKEEEACGKQEEACEEPKECEACEGSDCEKQEEACDKQEEACDKQDEACEKQEEACGKQDECGMTCAAEDSKETECGMTCAVEAKEDECGLACSAEEVKEDECGMTCATEEPQACEACETCEKQEEKACESTVETMCNFDASNYVAKTEYDNLVIKFGEVSNELDAKIAEFNALNEKYQQLQEQFNAINSEVEKKQIEEFTNFAANMINSEDELSMDEKSTFVAQLTEKCNNKEFSCQEDVEKYTTGVLAMACYTKKKEAKKNKEFALNIANSNVEGNSVNHKLTDAEKLKEATQKLNKL